MASATIKVIDNTCVTAFLKEITSVKLFEKCGCFYKFVTSKAVSEECREYFKNETLILFQKNLSVKDLDNHPICKRCMDYLKARYPYLHNGEISSFLVALFLYHSKRERYYYITDDNKMREVVSKLPQDNGFLQITGIKNFSDFKITGTIGLIKRFYFRKIICEQEIEEIIEDLKKSTFFITPELIERLRSKS